MKWNCWVIWKPIHIILEVSILFSRVVNPANSPNSPSTLGRGSYFCTFPPILAVFNSLWHVSVSLVGTDTSLSSWFAFPSSQWYRASFQVPLGYLCVFFKELSVLLPPTHTTAIFWGSSQVFPTKFYKYFIYVDSLPFVRWLVNRHLNLFHFSQWASLSPIKSLDSSWIRFFPLFSHFPSV